MINPVKIGHTFQDFIHVFNSMVVPGGNLGIARGSMPQIDSNYMPQFIQHLKDNGIDTKVTSIPAKALKLTQNEYNKVKVLKLMQKYRNSPKAMNHPIIVSADGHVLDGSHRFLAQYNLDPNSNVKVIQADADINHLLPIARKAGGVRYRNVSDQKLSK